MAHTLDTDTQDTLREMFPIGSDVRIRLAHVSRSGMTRDIVVMGPTGENVSRLVADAAGARFNRDRNAVRVPGAGMDMGFHLVYSLARVLHQREPGQDAGYALRHRWVD